MIRLLRRMRRGDFNFNVVGRSWTWFALSGAIIVLSVGSLAFKGIHAGLEFRGGTAFVVRAASPSTSVSHVRNDLRRGGLTDAIVQKVGDRGFQVETKHLTPAEQDQAAGVIASATGAKKDDVSVEDVGPKWGKQISAKAIRALVIFLLVVIVYMSIRLEPKMAGIAIVALLHDLVATAGIYSLTGFEVTPATIIALLTVLGYSLYDTVVIFDRVKEKTANLSAAGNVTYSEAANKSVNQVLMRSLNTSITGLLPVGSLLFVGSFLLGAQTLRELALALFIGLTLGTYSSIFIAAPGLAIWKERESRWSTLRTRIVARGAETSVPRPPAAVPVAPVAPSRPSEVVTAGAPAPSSGRQQQRPSGASSRNRRRKKRKRRKR